MSIQKKTCLLWLRPHPGPLRRRGSAAEDVLVPKQLIDDDE